MAKFNLQNWDCKIVEKKKIWFSISIALILIGIIVVSVFGFNVGIDFAGGTVLSATTGDLYDDSDYASYEQAINDVLAKHGVKAEVVQKLTSSEAPGIQIRFKNEINGTKANEDMMFELNSNVKAEVISAMEDVLTANGASRTDLNKNLEVTVSSVGATASAELLLMAFISIIVASALILVYVGLRFEFLSGLSAVTALAHDILIMASLMAIFRIQINSSFVAALITIVGYSINNTIVVFDRVRENKNSYSLRDATPTVLINTSVKETMTRSINTTITTLFTIVALAILGVSQIKEFALPIIFGLLAGTYSSICIAPTLWATFKDAHKRKLKKLKEKQRAMSKA